MQKISQNEIYLPAIQRKFVWGTDRIEKLFDSIMRGYPIGTFLFWFVRGDTKNNNTFYKFIQDYHERDRAWNEVAPQPDLRDQFIGVLDGQQRLNSMYVALQGSYAYKRKHGHWNDDGAFPKRFLYINLFYQAGEEDENGIAYDFEFLTEEKANEVDQGQYWFKVKDVLQWLDIAPVFSVIRDAAGKHPEHQEAFYGRGASILNTLWQRLCSDDVVSYFSIQDQELDKILDIFVRVNSAGLQLSKTDLLFSSIVAHWDEGRASIEEAIKALNRKGNRFAFDNDFVMRTCLVLTDLPILFKVNSFKKQNIECIQSAWVRIESALDATVDLLVEWGFCGETLPALNSVIPIAYFVFKGGQLESSKNDLRQYLIRTLLNQVFTSKTDRVLAAIRDHMRTSVDEGKTFILKSSRFALQDILSANLPEGRELSVEEADIEDWLSEKKGAYTFMVLSLLYPQLNYGQVKFHQDHIHPWSQFSYSNLKKLQLSTEEMDQWQEDRDRLPNLQLMEGGENESKNAQPLQAWVDRNPAARETYMSSNFVPSGASLDFKDFRALFDARKKLLRERIKVVFTP
jgi:hypothetical protein